MTTKKQTTDSSSGRKEKIEISGSKAIEFIKNIWKYLEERSFIVKGKNREVINFGLNWTVLIMIFAPSLVILCILIALITKCTLVIEKKE